MEFKHQISEGTYHILFYNAKFWAKIPKNGHYALIGAHAGERHYRVT